LVKAWKLINRLVISNLFSRNIASDVMFNHFFLLKITLNFENLNNSSFKIIQKSIL